jgi:RAB protein geranylgeranyltransferase component A
LYNYLDLFPQVVVLGTGLEESILASASSRNGHSVLHVDTSDHYGGEWAAFTFEGIQEWIGEQEKKEEEEEKESGKKKEIDDGVLILKFPIPWKKVSYVPAARQ